jgi:hypothetical protein
MRGELLFVWISWKVKYYGLRLGDAKLDQMGKSAT